MEPLPRCQAASSRPTCFSHCPLDNLNQTQSLTDALISPHLSGEGPKDPSTDQSHTPEPRFKSTSTLQEIMFPPPLCLGTASSTESWNLGCWLMAEVSKNVSLRISPLWLSDFRMELPGILPLLVGRTKEVQGKLSKDKGFRTGPAGCQVFQRLRSCKERHFKQREPLEQKQGEDQLQFGRSKSM